MIPKKKELNDLLQECECCPTIINIEKAKTIHYEDGEFYWVCDKCYDSAKEYSLNSNKINPIVTNFEQHLQNEAGAGHPFRDIIDNLEDSLILESIENYVELRLKELYNEEK